MRTLVWLGGLTLLLALVVGWQGQAGDGSELDETLAAWVSGLDRDQREEALLDFEDDERFDLRLAPFPLEGLRRDAMKESQWDAWLEVLATVLSPSGLAKVETIISLEREVGERDRRRLMTRLFGGFVHGEERYYVSLFGEPGSGTPWGMRFDGHHLSLNWTVTSTGALSVTPVFLGAEPREVPAGWERAGLRALHEEEDRALALWQALDPEQRARAELPFQPARGLVGGTRPLFVGEGERIDPMRPQGVARKELTPPQQALLDALIAVYFENYRADFAAARLAAIDAAGRDAVHFAFAGNLTPGEPGYYRIQGPTFLIEWDDTTPAADHVHTILREFEGDFGRDLLAVHYAQAHRARPAAGGGAQR